MSSSTHWRRTASDGQGRPGSGPGSGVNATPVPHRGDMASLAVAVGAVQYERPVDRDRLVQRIPYRAVLRDGKLDRPQRVRSVDALAIHDIPKVNVREARRHT